MRICGMRIGSWQAALETFKAIKTRLEPILNRRSEITTKIDYTLDLGEWKSKNQSIK